MEQQQALIRVEQQLALVEPARDWHLDERTRELGRRGIEQARRALHDAGRKAAA